MFVLNSTQNIDIEGRLDDRGGSADDGNPSKTRCMYDKLELAERLNDVDINLPFKENPSEWNITSTICGNI